MPSSYDKELVNDIFKNILWAIDQIQKRFQSIKSSDDFLRDDAGLEKLDSICMQLINIGEALKQVDKLTDQQLLKKYGEIEWNKIMGMRDIITHHYFDIDSEVVFTVCSEHLPEFRKVIEKIKTDIR